MTTGDKAAATVLIKMDYTLKKDSELERKILFLAGAPCCGKGTQSAKMINRYKFTYMAVGDHFRDEIKK